MPPSCALPAAGAPLCASSVLTGQRESRGGHSPCWLPAARALLPPGHVPGMREGCTPRPC